MKRHEILILAVLVVFYAVGFVGHQLEATRVMIVRLTPLALLLTAAASILPLVLERNKAAILWLALCFALGFASEAVGVATGAVFGAYAYGSVLGPQVLEVPLVIGLNWAVVVLGAAGLVVRFVPTVRGRPCPVVTALVVGLLTAAFDWLMEPVAIALGYWSWTGGAIPLRNYVAWFVISAVFALVWALARLRTASWLPTAALGVQALFFALLRASPVA